jgi:hypothetical protein
MFFRANCGIWSPRTQPSKIIKEGLRVLFFFFIKKYNCCVSPLTLIRFNKRHFIEIGNQIPEQVDQLIISFGSIFVQCVHMRVLSLIRAIVCRRKEQIIQKVSKSTRALCFRSLSGCHILRRRASVPYSVLFVDLGLMRSISHSKDVALLLSQEQEHCACDLEMNY